MAAYQDLPNLERDFRHTRAEDLDLRPSWHRLEAHVLICMLACYLVWHLRQALQVADSVQLDE